MKQASALRQELKNAVAQAAPDGLSGRGIVTCAGGARLFTSAYVLIRLLRETLRCKLPIEVWSFGADEMTDHMRHLLEALDVTLVDADKVLVRHPARVSNGWQLKPYSILHSSFAEVLFLDADQVPVRDPAALLEGDAYRKSGAVFWPDTVDLRADNPIWEYLGLEAAEVPAWESGQVLVDKRRHWGALAATLCLNEAAAEVYRMLYGDAATFTVAWRWAGADAAVVPHRPFRDPRVIVQRDFDGKPLFQHRTDAKFVLGGAQYAFDGEVHRDDCLRYLAALEAQWSGRMFRPPDRSIAAREAEARLAGVSAKLEMRADHTVDLDLLPGHEIGSGRSADRQNWYVVEGDEGLALILSDGWRVAYRLRSLGGGIWDGHQQAIVSAAARLVELPGNIDPLQGPGLVEQLVRANGMQVDADGQLEAALTLLVRAEPKLGEAVLAVAEQWPDLAGLCQRVLDATARPDRAPKRDLDVLARGYRSPSADRDA